MSTSALEPHAVFLDFDGTLGDHGIVPKVHVEALRAARANGHALFLCTGRPEPMVSPSVLAELDGIVASAGCYVQVGETVVSDERFPKLTARRTIEVLESHRLPFVLESPEGMFGNDHGVAHLQHLLESFNLGGREREPGSVGEGASDISRALRHTDDLHSVSFAKAVLWGSHLSAHELAKEIGPEVRPMPNSVADDGTQSGELQLWAIDKIDGVRRAAAHVGIPMERTVGCGDGLNDVKMLEGTALSVVIEGSAAAREIAHPTLTVGSPSQGGMADAFRALGLIG